MAKTEVIVFSLFSPVFPAGNYGIFFLFSPGRPREGETVFLGGHHGLFFPVFARQAPAKGKRCF